MSIFVVFTTCAADALGHGSCPELEFHDLLRRQILVDRGSLQTPAADAQTVDLSRTFPLDFVVLDELCRAAPS